MDKQKKLQELREMWKATIDPVERKLIESRAKLLRMSMHPADVYQEKKDEELEKTVREVLL